MEKFWEIFNDKYFNDFIDKTYVDIEHTKDFKNIENINKEVNVLLEKFPISSENSPYAGIFGLPGSGKSTLARQITGENDKLKIVSTDDFLAKLKKENSSFPQARHDDEFRKHEYKFICCLILSEEAEDKIIDFGGASLLQPGLGLLGKRILESKLINLKINDENRILNLAQDAILEQGHRTRIKNQTTKIKQQNENRFKQLSNNFIELRIENKNLKDIKQQIQSKFGEETLNLFNNIYEICEDFDKNNRWRLEVFKCSSNELNFEEATNILRGK